MAKICMVLTAPTINENIKILERNIQLIDMVELRTDKLDIDQFHLVTSFPDNTRIPVILTCRKKCDGGDWIDSEERRMSLMEQWLDGSFSYIDLEMDTKSSRLTLKAADSGVKIIRSFHDFFGVPPKLFEKMQHSDGDIVKGAVYPKSSEELYKLVETGLKLKDFSDKPYILLGMGDFGFPTRILAEKIGSYLTFCSDSSATSGAPGHCTASDLNDIYNFRNISGLTQLNCIIGNPVSQSRSPNLHNKWYRENGLDAVYVPFLTDSPGWFIKIAGLLGVNGSSVTVPFKREIIPLVQNTDQAVDAIGAANTIYHDEEGLWSATNTDTYGLIKPLLDLLETDKLTGWKTSVIGAGGAARAAVFALQDKGADVAVFNRTLSRAKELAEQLNCRAFSLGEESSQALREYGSIIIQTTSAGMPPLEEVDPLEFYHFNGSEILYDIIYKPEVTRLMARAKKAGCSVLGGLKMLEEQAVLQFDIFQRGSVK